MTGQEKRSFLDDEDRRARSDEAQDEPVAGADKLKRHGDQLQDSVDKATGKDRRGEA